MRVLTTCLLISDDVDDHQAFTEAFQQILPGAVVLVVMNQMQAYALLKSRKHIPNYLFLDLTSDRADARSFIDSLRTIEGTDKMSLTFYGNDEELQSLSDNSLNRFHKEYDFEQLKNLIRAIVANTDL